MADQAAQMTESLRRTSPPKSAATAGVETNASAVRPFSGERARLRTRRTVERLRSRNMNEHQIAYSSQ